MYQYEHQVRETSSHFDFPSPPAINIFLGKKRNTNHQLRSTSSITNRNAARVIKTRIARQARRQHNTISHQQERRQKTKHKPQEQAHNHHAHTTPPHQDHTQTRTRHTFE